MRGVDNFAHAGGFFGGYLAARLLDPLKPERVDHIVMALVCLVATFLAIAASVVTALPMSDTASNDRKRRAGPQFRTRPTFYFLLSTFRYYFGGTTGTHCGNT